MDGVPPSPSPAIGSPWQQLSTGRPLGEWHSHQGPSLLGDVQAVPKLNPCALQHIMQRQQQHTDQQLRGNLLPYFGKDFSSQKPEERKTL